LRLQCIIAGAFAVLAGSVATVHFCFGLAKFGGLEYAPRVTLLSSIHALGPAVSAWALLLALLIWTHPLDADAIRPSLLRAAPRALLVALVSVPVTTTLAASSSFFVTHWLYDVPWNVVAASRSVLSLSDFPAVIETFVSNAALAGALCWFTLPVLRRRGWSLLQKLGATWVAAILLRIVGWFVYGS
jgi:hypothetical protein